MKRVFHQLAKCLSDHRERIKVGLDFIEFNSVRADHLHINEVLLAKDSTFGANSLKMRG